MKTRFDEIPSDIQLQILDYLACNDLITTVWVNKQLHGFFEEISFGRILNELKRTKFFPGKYLSWQRLEWLINSGIRLTNTLNKQKSMLCELDRLKKDAFNNAIMIRTFGNDKKAKEFDQVYFNGLSSFMNYHLGIARFFYQFPFEYIFHEERQKRFNALVLLSVLECILTKDQEKLKDHLELINSFYINQVKIVFENNRICLDFDPHWLRLINQNGKPTKRVLSDFSLEMDHYLVSAINALLKELGHDDCQYAYINGPKIS